MTPTQQLVLWWQVEVLNPDETPAQQVQVVVDPGAVQGVTANNGMARLTVNTQEDSQSLIITVCIFWQIKTICKNKKKGLCLMEIEIVQLLTLYYFLEQIILSLFLLCVPVLSVLTYPSLLKKRNFNSWLD